MGIIEIPMVITRKNWS